jgi:hypothetical protein
MTNRALRLRERPPVTAVEILNLCPHNIDMLVGEVEVSLAPVGLARCTEQRHSLGYAISATGVRIPLMSCSYGAVTGLPEPKPGRVYVVSHLVAKRCPERNDLVVPDQLVRDDYGVIIAARALSVLI